MANMVAVVLSSAFIIFGLPAQSPGDSADRKQVTVQGRVICLDSANRPVSSAADCAGAEVRFGLKNSVGALYLFSWQDPFTKMFLDPQVRERELQIAGRVHSGMTLEIISIHSIVSRKLYDIFYYCDVCSIKAFEPGLCYCCQNDFELRETPVPGSP